MHRAPTDKGMQLNQPINNLKAALNTHLERAQFPPEYCTAQRTTRRVIRSLEERVGHSSLSIEEICQDLLLSKRTLQRRLLDEGTSFLLLKDQCRRHYALKMLMEENRKVDYIFAALDFSNRTCLSRAFIRWTGFAPTTFRRLFRDVMNQES